MIFLKSDSVNLIIFFILYKYTVFINMNIERLKLYFEPNSENITTHFFKNYVNHIEVDKNECDFIVCGKIEFGNTNPKEISNI